jgi:hypothetical protein
MKKLILCVSLVASTQAAMAAIPMARFIRVTDSRTIVVAHLNGPEEVVHLVNVDVPAQDEMAARAFIQDNLARSFVYVEDGKVYRSPDALFINRELAYGAYSAPGLKMFYLGQVNPGPHAQAAPRATPARAPLQASKKASRPPAPSRHSRRR